MADTFTMRDSLGAVWAVLAALSGLGLVLLGLGFLCFSEAAGRKSLLGKEEFVLSARVISADKVDPANDGQPVIATGLLRTNQTIEDAIFGVTFTDVVSAYREVSMRQHDEVWVGSGDSERMTGHKQVWSSESIPCPTKPNPPRPVNSKFIMASDYRVGAFSIPKDMAAHIEGSKLSGGETYAIIKGKASAASLKGSAGRPQSISGSRALAAPLLWFGFLFLISFKISLKARPGFAAFLATVAVPLGMLAAHLFVWRVQPYLNL
jgi:hypothetical protein